MNLLYYLIISLCLILLLKTCDINSLKSPSTSPEGNLLIWHSTEGKIGDLIINAVKDFTELTPNVKILLQFIKPEQNPNFFIEKSETGFGSSALILSAKDIQELVKKQLINPIDPESFDTSIYFPSTLEQVSYQGKIYGIPLGSNTKILCYNRAKLNNTNDPFLSNPPTTLEGLIQRAIKGYSVGLVSSFEDTFWGIGTFGATFFTEPSLINHNMKVWAEWLNWLKNASLQPNFIVSKDRTILHNAFERGKLAYYICDSTEILDFADTLNNDLRVALLPKGEKGNPTPLLYTKIMVFNHSNTDSENLLGLAFAKYMTNPEQQLSGIIATQSFIPTNRQIRPNVDLLPLESVLLKQAESAVAIPLNNLAEIIQLFEEGEILYQKAFVGEISTDDAAKKLMLLMDNLTK
ncbi:MAG: extracellular solute-binding protein [Geminocystis sp. GBBB08]|nr:extracellular solute-binding protein [Geminocystis sp. GBBB08]